MRQNRWGSRLLGDWPVVTAMAWPELMNQKHAAAYLGMSPKTFQRLAPVEAVVTRYVDRGVQRESRRFRRADLDCWLAQSTRGARRSA